MDRRTVRACLRALSCATICVPLALPAAAAAQVTTDLVNWNLTESTSTWPSDFHISSSGDGWAAFRWIDSPAKTTVISGNSCADLALYGQAVIGVGNTAYHNLFHANPGQCFLVRGRTSIGSGSMVNHDGRVRR